MELYSEADKTIWEEKYMPVSLKKGQKVSLTKGNPGLKNVVVGIGWDINAFDTGGDFDLDAAAFCLTDSGRVSDSNDFVFYGNLVHPSGAVQHMGDNLTGAGDGDDEQIKIDLSKIPANITKIAFTVTIYDAEARRQNFGQVSNAFVRIFNEVTGEEILRYDLGEDFSIMRTLPLNGMLTSLSTNYNRRNKNVRLYELGNVYLPKELPLTELPEERLHLGFVAFGEHEDFFAVKGALEDLAASFGVTFEVERAEDVPYLHPGIAAYILCNGVRVGSFGKLANDVQAGLDLPRDSRANQKIFLGEIDYETLVAQLPAGLRYHPLPEFDTVARDLALVADEETPCGTIIAEMKRACKQLADVELFDIYRSEAIGAGKKSMAFTLHFAPENKALEAADVDRFVKKILGNLKFKLGIEIR